MQPFTVGPAFGAFALLLVALATPAIDFAASPISITVGTRLGLP